MASLRRSSLYRTTPQKMCRQRARSAILTAVLKLASTTRSRGAVKTELTVIDVTFASSKSSSQRERRTKTLMSPHPHPGRMLGPGAGKSTQRRLERHSAFHVVNTALRSCGAEDWLRRRSKSTYPFFLNAKLWQQSLLFVCMNGDCIPSGCLPEKLAGVGIRCP